MQIIPSTYWNFLIKNDNGKKSSTPTFRQQQKRQGHGDPALVIAGSNERLTFSQPPPSRQAQEAGAEKEQGGRQWDKFVVICVVNTKGPIRPNYVVFMELETPLS